MRLIHLAAVLLTLGLISCQPKEPKEPTRPRHQAAVLDYTMPRLTGIEFAEELNALDPEVSVIIATGNLDVAPLENARPANVKAVLRKPFRVEDILSVTSI